VNPEHRLISSNSETSAQNVTETVDEACRAGYTHDNTI